MPKSFGKKAQGARLERMLASPLWRDGQFRNIHPMLPGLRSGVSPGVREFLCGGERRTPGLELPIENPREAWRTAPQSGLRATWLGHSTVLIEIDGARLLTDPVFGKRASPVSLAGPRRFHPPPAALAEIPEIDAVLISHDHYDHLDYPTIKGMLHSPVPFITSLGVGAHLEAWGVAPERITELDWWESTTLPQNGVRITATPSQHFSGRGPGQGNSTLWSSFSIQGERRSVFFSGDTGLTTQYKEIRERMGEFDLVMLEIGAYHPSWGSIHLGPQNALTAFEMLGGKRLLPVHWSTFNLAMHSWDDPAETLLRLAPAAERLLMPRLGAASEPAQVDAPDAWWRKIADEERRVAAKRRKSARDEREEDAAAPESVTGVDGLQMPLD